MHIALCRHAHLLVVCASVSSFHSHNPIARFSLRPNYEEHPLHHSLSRNGRSIQGKIPRGTLLLSMVAGACLSLLASAPTLQPNPTSFSPEVSSQGVCLAARQCLCVLCVVLFVVCLVLCTVGSLVCALCGMHTTHPLCHATCAVCRMQRTTHPLCCATSGTG